MDEYLGLLHGCYSSTESTGETAGTWMPYQSLLWSLLDILLGSLLHSILERLLEVCMTEQCLRAAPERCILRKELSCPHEPFGWGQSLGLWKVWCKCWRTESTCLSSSGTMITITNTNIITIITMAIIPLPSSQSAMNWMCTHTPTICRLRAADFATKSESQDPIVYFFCRI